MDVPLVDDFDRPAFMVTLGVLPPYTREDVDAAYRGLVLQVHPDRGGTVGDFLKVQEAYDRAVEYVRFHSGRRGWIAAQVENYVRQEKAVDEVRRLGGTVETEEIDWMKRSLGDGFAMLTDRVRVIRLPESAADDAFIGFLAGPPSRTPYLLELSLAGTRITDEGLRALSAFTLLTKLNVARTRVSGGGIQSLLEQLPDLLCIDVQGTAVGLLSRWRFQRMLRKRRAESAHRKLLLLPGQGGGA